MAPQCSCGAYMSWIRESARGTIAAAKGGLDDAGAHQYLCGGGGAFLGRPRVLRRGGGYRDVAGQNSASSTSVKTLRPLQSPLT
ncbi:hypothetical protein J2S55_008594 [Streptosporangium brasiliense]|uniref:Uncharacterized protein n=1 Tax=Streptosporangium brasiliense TaxID=47480 RepID=A0ABT9RJ58_9ACTN|nr:hypothetical protein [Streptosporangium brasiliense]